MIKIRHKGLSAALSFGLIVFSASIGALGQSNSDQNIQHNSASSDRNLKSVARINPSTLAMEFTLPIAIYPGRAGTPVPVSLNYSSSSLQIVPSSMIRPASEVMTPYRMRPGLRLEKRFG